MKTKLLVIALAGVASLLNASTALAKSWNLEGQTIDPDKRINQGLKDGTLSTDQGAEFRDQELNLSVKEEKLRQSNGGALKTADEKSLSKQLNALMDHIASVRSLKADNTGKNLGDARIGAKTPQIQSESRDDLRIIGSIRKRLLNNYGLSTNAKNVKVICIKGNVTLRGPVDNASEKAKIGSTAKDCAGVSTVNNQLDIKQ